jgi:hypothetical protein
MRIFLLSILLSSCSAQWHYQKACDKDSAYCGTDVLIDTMLVTDTLYLQRTDTTNVIDTITIDTGSIQVQIIREYDVIRTTIKQKPDTTYLTITKTVPPKIIYKQTYWWLLFIPFILCLILKK